MRRPAAHLRPGVAARLAELDGRNPEWRAWLALLGEVAAGLEELGGQVRVEGAPSASPTPATPLLDGRTVHVDPGAVRDLLTRLLKAAGSEAPARVAARSLGHYRPGGETARRLVEAAIRYDDPVITATAEAEGVDPAALGTVVRLAAVPLLAACARELAGRMPDQWPSGYCPVCGSWPLLAELRGVERERSLRCGRCGAAWRTQWLRCTYCGEARHGHLGALAAADGLESRKAETCATCRHYLKSIAALAPLSHMDLLLADLDTVELDLAARERGYGRPAEPGYRVECRVAALA